MEEALAGLLAPVFAVDAATSFPDESMVKMDMSGFPFKFVT